MKFVFSALILLLTACAQGTGTGNPYTNTENPADPSSGTETSMAYDVAENLCLNINRCHTSASQNTCFTEILSLTTFNTPLGLTGTNTLQEIITQEVVGSLTGNSTATISCISAMNALSCSDANMTAAYDSTAANPFAAAAAVLDPVCAGVF